MDQRESIILIPVPEVEPIVGKLRKKFDPSAIKGIPAHITLLFPFKHPEEITPEDIEKLKEILKVNKFEFRLSKINTFPGVVFIEPLEKNNFINLIEKIYSAFPDYPPFEGKFLPEINPHLTIGHRLGDEFEECLARAKEIESNLPINAVAKEVWIMISENNRWTTKEKFSLL